MHLNRFEHFSASIFITFERSTAIKLYGRVCCECLFGDF